MNPLAVFPSLLTFGLIAPLLLRVSVAVILILLARERRGKAYSWSAIVYGVLAALLALGLYTQVAALLSIIVLKLDYLADRKAGVLPPNWERFALYGVAIVILLSLMFTGPGFFAFDLPL